MVVYSLGLYGEEQPVDSQLLIKRIDEKMNKHELKHVSSVIFWDYNGTILDDVNTCIMALNSMLSRRGLPAITLEKYIDIFDFPIIQLYKRAGFDLEKESFTEILAPEYISLYQPASYRASLRSGVLELLKTFKSAGCTQVLLSASQRDLLLEQTNTLGLTPFFDSVLGLSDIYAKSKSELAHQWILEKRIESSNICVIGDTVHDFQVSLELGCQCILICGGHNSKQRLQESNAIVIEDFSELLEMISNWFSLSYKSLWRKE